MKALPPPLTSPLANTTAASEERVKELERLLREKDAKMERALAEKEAQMDLALAEKEAQMARVIAEKDSALAEKEARLVRDAEQTTAPPAQGQPKAGRWWSVAGRIKKIAPHNS